MGSVMEYNIDQTHTHEVKTYVFMGIDTNIF